MHFALVDWVIRTRSMNFRPLAPHTRLVEPILLFQEGGY